MNAVVKESPPEGRFERTEPYLRQHQVKELVEERTGIEKTLNAPAYIRNQVQDAPAMLKRIKAIDRQLHENVATPYAEKDIDPAVRRERELRENIVSTMPTQAEMRRTPAGAIDKHRKWESRHKKDILEWKNLRLRLHVSGMDDKHPDAREVANIEQYRPSNASHELNMDNMLIPGKNIHLPSGMPAIHNVMDPESAAEAALEKQIIARLFRENPNTTLAEFRDLMRSCGLNPPDAESTDAPQAKDETTTKPGSRGKK